ncbi:MAG: zinc-ribbon domain-containing protein [Desulfohalobiaceae bacterium]|nr:zinc-ribbon domain-containing protein [Desulfohalobiaceae bacterium]
MRITCPNCGFSRDMPEDRIPPTARLATCPKCRHKFRLREEEESLLLEETGDESAETSSAATGEEPREGDESRPGSNGPADGEDIWRRLEEIGGDTSASDVEAGRKARGREDRGEAKHVPWEDLESLGFFPGLFQTVKQVMLTPVEFFSGLSGGDGFGQPTAFYLLIMEVPALAMVLWLMSGLFPQAQGEAGGLFHVGLTGIGSLTFLLVFPVFMLINLFLSSGLYHLLLIALGEGSAGFEGTFRVVCYSAAPMVLALVPVFGMWVGGIWQLVCLFFGFKLVHGTNSFKAALPIIVLQVAFVLLLSGASGLA